MTEESGDIVKARAQFEEAYALFAMPVVPGRRIASAL